jgi:hypothetical protein
MRNIKGMRNNILGEIGISNELRMNLLNNITRINIITAVKMVINMDKVSKFIAS